MSDQCEQQTCPCERCERIRRDEVQFLRQARQMIGEEAVVEMLDRKAIDSRKRTHTTTTTTSSQPPVKKRSREEVLQDSIKDVISLANPTGVTNYVIHCTGGDKVYVCFEFLQAYTKYFNSTMRKMNPEEIHLPYDDYVIADGLCVAVFGCTYPWPNNENTILDLHHQRFQFMDYIGCEYGEYVLMQVPQRLKNEHKPKAYVLVPEYREVLRGYLRDNIVSLRNKSEYWPVLKEHIDDILVD